MRPTALTLALAAMALPALAADSSQSSLRVAVTVTRSCTVSTGSAVQVQCTRSHDAAIQTSDGRSSRTTPLVVSGPGTMGATVPAATSASGARTLTILF